MSLQEALLEQADGKIFSSRRTSVRHSSAQSLAMCLLSKSSSTCSSAARKTRSRRLLLSNSSTGTTTVNPKPKFIHTLCVLTPTGFDRNKLYADKIREFITSTSRKSKAPVDRPTSTLHLPVTFSTHVNHIVAAITTHLNPILTLNHSISTTPSILPSLHAITTHAALLSLHMRLDPQTHYAFTPAFKEQPYIPSEMHPSNHAAMLATHPKGNGDTDGISAAEQSRRARLSPEELIRMKRDEPLVQIALFPGLIAYRLGGWETRASTATNPRFETGCEGRGFRARRLTEAWVYCRWGRPRVFEDGKPADDPEVHGARWKGGFVEFFPGVEGVCDPDPERTVRREAAKKKKKYAGGSDVVK